MKDKVKKLLQKEIDSMNESIETMQLAAMKNPFGPSIDLGSKAKDVLEKSEPRIRVRIYQNIRLKVLKQILEDIERL